MLFKKSILELGLKGIHIITVNVSKVFCPILSLRVKVLKIADPVLRYIVSEIIMWRNKPRYLIHKNRRIEDCRSVVCKLFVKE
jgi:hypothetical protein